MSTYEYLILHRISMLFLVYIIYNFTKRRFSRGLTIVILGVLFGITFIFDLLFFIDSKMSLENHFIWGIVNLLLIALTSVYISRYFDFRPVFVSLIAICSIFPAAVLSSLNYKISEDILVTVIAQVILNTLTCFVLIKTVRTNLLHDMESTPSNWGVLCIIPLLFFITASLLAFWPQSLAKNPKNLPGIVLLFILMYASHIILEWRISKNKVSAHEEKLDFMLKYSDRLRSQTQKLQLIHNKVSSLYDISKRALELIDENRIDDLRLIFEDICENMPNDRGRIPLQNMTVSYVLFPIEREAKEMNVSFSPCVQLPNFLGEKEYEFSLILEAFLSKALYYAGKSEEKTLSLALYCVGDNVVFEIRASIPKETDVSNISSEKICEEDLRLILKQKNMASFVSQTDAKLNISVQNKNISAEFTAKL